MTQRRLTILVLVSGLAFVTPRLGAQSPAQMDSLLQRLVGTWDMAATVRGRTAKQSLRVERALQKKFVQLHILDLGKPPAYEAMVMIGVDSSGSRYIAHWMD